MDRDGYILFVRKNSPDWQSGLLSGLTCEVGRDGDAVAAVSKEWRSTLGSNPPNWRALAVYEGARRRLIFLSTVTREQLRQYDGKRTVHDEVVAVRKLMDMSWRRDCLHDLKWVVPLAFERTGRLVVSAREV